VDAATEEQSDHGVPTTATPTTAPPDDTQAPSLPLPLCVLFALNGLSLALPMTALLYVVNTRVALSVALLPAYGAVAFLPNALRPLYAYLTAQLAARLSREGQIATLLLLSALSTAVTAVLPTHAVVGCFGVAFLRGVSSAWPEFLLGLTLVDEARSGRCGMDGANNNTVDNLDATCAVFQAQAAVWRNSGSLVANVGAAGFLLVAGAHAHTRTTMNALLLAAAFANVVGAFVAVWYRVGRQESLYMVVEEEEEDESADLPTNYQSIPPPLVDSEIGDLDEDSLLSLGDTAAAAATHDDWYAFFCNCQRNPNVRLVVLLQLTVVLLALRQPIEELTSAFVWQGCTSTSVVALLCTFVASVWIQKWPRSQKVGLFLILRHAMPSVGYLMSSYLWDIFSETPFLLQLLSFVDMAIATAAAWSYGKVWSAYASEAALPALIAGMTILAALASLTQLWLVRALPALTSTPLLQFGAVVLVRGLVSWTGEWRLLPDIVLATTSLKYHHSRQGASHVAIYQVVRDEAPACQTGAKISLGDAAEEEHPMEEDATQLPALADEAEDEVNQPESAADRHAIHMQYGTLISCMDFGGQLGALTLGALVAALDVSRENNWGHLDDLILLCGVLGAASSVLVLIIK
jgi:hypothetical protein